MSQEGFLTWEKEHGYRNWPLFPLLPMAKSVHLISTVMIIFLPPDQEHGSQAPTLWYANLTLMRHG